MPDAPPKPSMAPCPGGDEGSAPENRIRSEVRPALGDVELNELFGASWPDHRPASFSGMLAHSLCWVAAYGEGALLGFVNVTTDGGVHAYILDTTLIIDVVGNGAPYRRRVRCPGGTICDGTSSPWQARRQWAGGSTERPSRPRQQAPRHSTARSQAHRDPPFEVSPERAPGILQRRERTRERSTRRQQPRPEMRCRGMRVALGARGSSPDQHKSPAQADPVGRRAGLPESGRRESKPRCQFENWMDHAP